MVARLRSLGEHAEAEELESELRDVESNVARLRWSRSFEGLVAGARTAGYSPRWPSGHIAWVFSGNCECERGAMSFLAEGAACNERLMFFADEPAPERWPRDLLDRGDLLIASIFELIGPERVLDPALAREMMATALTAALRDGYSGIRVASDATSLLETPEFLEAWMQLDGVVEAFLAENPMTVLCCFDRTRASAASLQVARELHRVSV